MGIQPNRSPMDLFYEIRKSNGPEASAREGSLWNLGPFIAHKRMERNEMDSIFAVCAINFIWAKLDLN